MIKIINTQPAGIRLEDVQETTPIFAKRDGRLAGMLVDQKYEGWILCLGGPNGATGYHNTREEAVHGARQYKYSFWIDTPEGMKEIGPAPEAGTIHIDNLPEKATVILKKGGKISGVITQFMQDEVGPFYCGATHNGVMTRRATRRAAILAAIDSGFECYIENETI